MKFLFTNLYARHLIDEMPEQGLSHLPDRVWPFMWFFMRQMRGRFALLMVIGIVAGVFSNLAPYFFGQMIGVFTTITDKTQLWSQLAWPFGLYVGLVLIASPALYNFHGWMNSITLPFFAHMIRRQLAWYLHQHSWRYFQDDFAGRLAGKVVEMPYAMRMVVGDIVNPFVYAGVTFATTLVLFLWIGHQFALVSAVYIGLYLLNLRYFIPRVRNLSELTSRKRSIMRGRFMDILANIFLVKIFARKNYEDSYFRESLHTTAESAAIQEVTITRMFRVQHVLNSSFMMSLVLITVHQWQSDQMTAAQISMLLPMALNMIQATFWLTEV